MQKFFQVENSHLFSNNETCFVVNDLSVETDFPNTYEEFSNNPDAYPNINKELSYDSSKFLQTPHEFNPDNFINELSKQLETNTDNVVLKSGDIIIEDDEIEDELKECGYAFKRKVNEYKIKKDDNGEYRIYNKEGKETKISKTLGLHGSSDNEIYIIANVVSLDESLLNDHSTELKGYIKKIEETLHSDLQYHGVFVHEKKHAFNSIATKLLENENLANNKPMNTCSYSEVGFLNRADEISARREEFLFYAKEYYKRGMPEDTSEFDFLFKHYLTENKFTEKSSDKNIKDLTNINKINSYVTDFWFKANAAAYGVTLGSQILTNIEAHEYKNPVFDTGIDSYDYERRLNTVFKTKVGNDTQTIIPTELQETIGYRDAYILSQESTIIWKNSKKTEKFAKLGITKETLEYARKAARKANRTKTLARTKGLEI